MKTNTYAHLEKLCAAKRIVCERRGKKIELTTPDGGTTAECETVAEALDTFRNDPAFAALPSGGGSGSDDDLRSRFAGTTDDFREYIIGLAKRAGLDPLAVYKLWRDYSDECGRRDQSPVFSEFEEWNKAALAPKGEELYLYELVDNCRVVSTAKAQSLDEALAEFQKTSGCSAFRLTACFYRMATVAHRERAYGVRWSPVDREAK